MSKTATMDVLVGTHIREVLARAVAQVEETGKSVTFDFNGTLHEVVPGDTYLTAKARAEERTGHPILSAEEEREQARRSLEEMERSTREAIETAGAPTEAQMRDAKVPWPKTEEELIDYVRSLVDRPHDYGTCVYAMSMAATATFNYVSGKLGVTGFQASCADMDILRRTRGWEWGRLLDYTKLLYPQTCDAEHFPSHEQLIEENKGELAKRARALLAERERAHSAVVAHWQWLASLVPAENQAPA